jgi:oligoribonuclease NrnB/cAMP/cGMP phosphodiesterase (DHH superfamily)
MEMYKLYSHNDLDGVGCGILAKLAFGDQGEVVYNSVGGIDSQILRFLETQEDKKANKIFITDLSVNSENEKKLDEFVKGGGEVVLIDHHKTSLHLNDHSWGNVSVNDAGGNLTSATSLFYEYLVGHQFLKSSTGIEEFVELVRQYDTWDWERNGNITAKQLNDLFYLGSIEDFEEKMISRLHVDAHFQFSEFEEKLLDLEEGKIVRYIRKKSRELVQVFIGEFCVGIVHAESYHSELGNALGKENDHLDYIAILNLGSKKISFRTIHDVIDVSAIAREFGGGGHAKAAGCSMTEKAFVLFVKAAFEHEPIKLDAFRNQYNVKNMPRGSLYENRKGEQFFIYETDNGDWVVEKNRVKIEKSFSTFHDAEKYIKRTNMAALAKDDQYVEFLKVNSLKK